MSEKDKQLSAFIKKQISQKATKKAVTATTTKAVVNSNKTVSKSKDASEEMTEEEKLEEAKKLSRSKAAQSDQTEMLKKLFLEKVVKYILVITLFAIFAIGIIESGPAIAGFLNGLISRIIMGAIS